MLLVDDGGLYGHGLTSAFAAEGARGGVRIIGRRVAAPDGDGLPALAREVRTLKPRAVVYGGSPSDGAAQSVVRLTTPAAHANPRGSKTHGLGHRPAAKNFIKRMEDSRSSIIGSMR